MILFQAAHTGLPSIVSEPVPAGVPYEVTATADGETWMVAAGVGIGASVQVSDPAAPFDVPTIYTVSAGTVEVDWLEREFEGAYSSDTLILSRDGRARFDALFEGDAAMSWSPGLTFAQPLARRFPAYTQPLSPGGPSWVFEGRVPLADVRGARRALDEGVLWVVHSHKRCVDDCPLPRVMLAGVDGSVSEGSWTEGRTYSFTVRQLEHGATGVPVVTWGEAKAADVRWGPSTSFESIREAIAGGP